MKRFNRSMNSYMFNKVRTMAVACGIAMVSGNICGLCGTNTPGTGDATGGEGAHTVANHNNCVGIDVVNDWKIHGYAICDGGKLKENLDGVFVLKTDHDNAINGCVAITSLKDKYKIDSKEIFDEEGNLLSDLHLSGGVENHDNCVGKDVVNDWKICDQIICEDGKLKENLNDVFVLKADHDNAIKNAAKNGAEQALKKYDKISEFNEGDKLFIKCSCESITYCAYVEVGDSNGIGKITLETLKAKKIKSNSNGNFIFLNFNIETLKEKDINVEVLFAERKS